MICHNEPESHHVRSRAETERFVRIKKGVTEAERYNTVTCEILNSV